MRIDNRFIASLTGDLHQEIIEIQEFCDRICGDSNCHCKNQKIENVINIAIEESFSAGYEECADQVRSVIDY